MLSLVAKAQLAVVVSAPDPELALLGHGSGEVLTGTWAGLWASSFEGPIGRAYSSFVHSSTLRASSLRKGHR